MTTFFPLSDCLRTSHRTLRRLAVSRMLLRITHLACALLGVYAIVFTYMSLSQCTHERRLRDVERLLLIGLLDAESGQRAYLLTNDRLFLAQYEAGTKAIELYEPLYGQALASDDGKKLFARASVLLRLKRTDMDMTIATHDNVGPEQAITIVRDLRGHQYTLQIYDVLRQIQAAEARKTVPFELWRVPSEPDIHDPNRVFSPSALLMRLAGR